MKKWQSEKDVGECSTLLETHSLRIKIIRILVHFALISYGRNMFQNFDDIAIQKRLVLDLKPNSTRLQEINSALAPSTGTSPIRQLSKREIYTIASPHFHTFLPHTPNQSLPSSTIDFTMAEIKIDKNLFQERLSHFMSAWKTDKRSGDALFNGASSIVILMGKTEEAASFLKNNAIHV